MSVPRGWWKYVVAGQLALAVSLGIQLLRPSGYGFEYAARTWRMAGAFTLDGSWTFGTPALWLNVRRSFDTRGWVCDWVFPLYPIVAATLALGLPLAVAERQARVVTAQAGGCHPAPPGPAARWLQAVVFASVASYLSGWLCWAALAAWDYVQAGGRPPGYLTPQLLPQYESGPNPSLGVQVLWVLTLFAFAVGLLASFAPWYRPFRAARAVSSHDTTPPAA